MDLQKEISTYNETVALLNELSLYSDTFFIDQQTWETFTDSYFDSWNCKIPFSYKNIDTFIFGNTFTKKTNLSISKLRNASQSIIKASNLVKKIQPTIIPMPTQAPESETEKLTLAKKLAPFYKEICTPNFERNLKETFDVFQKYETYINAAQTLNEMAKELNILPKVRKPSTDESTQLFKKLTKKVENKITAQRCILYLLCTIFGVLPLIIASIVTIITFPNAELNFKNLFIVAGIFTIPFIPIAIAIAKSRNKNLTRDKPWIMEKYCCSKRYAPIWENSLSEALQKLDVKNIKNISTALSYLIQITESYNLISRALDIRYNEENLQLYENLLKKGFADTIKEAEQLINEKKKRDAEADEWGKVLVELVETNRKVEEQRRQAERDKARLEKTLRDIKKGADALNDLKEIEKEKQKALDDIKNSLHHY